VCWVVFQVEEAPPGTTPILLTVALYLVEGPRRQRRSRRQPCRSSGRADAQSSADIENSAVSLNRTAKLLRESQPGPNEVHSQRPSGASRQATAVAATPATAAAPKTPASAAGGEYLEGVLTRLAGAAELGTDPLIYVRRADVAEVVDVLTDLARSPLGPTVTSPALARLTLLRRSRRRDSAPDGGKRVGSPAPGSALHRRPHSSRCHGNSNGVGRLRSSPASASPSPPRSRATVAGGRALFQDGDMTPPLRVLTGANPASTRVTFRARSPAGSPRGDTSGNGGASPRRVRGAQEGRQHRLQQRVRSKSPSSSPVEAALLSCALSTTPVALGKNKEAPRSAADGPPATRGIDDADMMSPGLANDEKKEPGVPGLLAAKMPHSVGKDPTASELKKIRCVPVKGEGTAFDDFWSSGWG
ncbi:unnamed protein product, partial [Hapterophycus canaliculatus]